ncbi:hypothetical protein QBC39DRAFT_362216 [Podospora conica]|nr:hypothetical protein QBC39DRAFT_362216 [Schizothecium conicum]
MCRGNSEKLVCRTSIETLLVPGSRLNFAPGCQRLIWQYVIRERLGKAPTAALADAGPWVELLRQLHLVRPDGNLWSPVSFSVVVPKLLTNIQRRARDAVEFGLARYEGGKVIWEDWVDGFLSPRWDGTSFDEESARELLQEGGEEAAPGGSGGKGETAPGGSGGKGEETVTEQETRPGEIEGAAAEISPGEDDGAAAEISPGKDEGAAAEGQNDKSAKPRLPETVGDPTGVVLPWLSNLPASSVAAFDSVTYAGSNRPRRPTYRPHKVPTTTQEPIAEEAAVEEGDDDDDDAWLAAKSIQELRSLQRQGFRNLLDGNRVISQLRKVKVDDMQGTRHPDLPRAYEAREDLLEQLYYLGDVIDQKVAAEALGDEAVLFGRWLMSGMIWEWACAGEMRQSPIIRRRVQARVDWIANRAGYGTGTGSLVS